MSMLQKTGIAVAGLAVLVVGVYFAITIGYESTLEASAKPGPMEMIESNVRLSTVNTTRLGSDDPVQTAVAVSQTIYPVTEPENTPGAVILVNRNRLPEVLVAANRVQHFPVNAPLLYVDQNSIPELTRSELLRLKPEGVAFDRNTQVYLVGTIGDSVREEVERLGFNTRVLTAPDPVLLAEVVDNWTSTQHGDHENVILIANLDRPETAIPATFWNAHAGDGFAFVTDDGVPEATRRMLERRANGPWLYLFGDESVISERVARELAAYGHVTRMPKADLPSISAFFAGFKDTGMDWGAMVLQAPRQFGWGLSEAGHNAIFVSLDGSAGWQNILPATTLSHMGKHAPVLVVNPNQVPRAVSDYLELLKPYPTAPRQQLLNHGWIIGGEETIDWQTQTELDLMLEGHMPDSGQGGGG